MKQFAKELGSVLAEVLIASSKLLEIKEYEELSNKPMSEMTFAMVERREALKEKYEL